MTDPENDTSAQDSAATWLSESLTVRATSLAVVYFAAAVVGNLLTRESNDIATLWPPNAILLSVLLRSPPAEWTAYVLACGLANVAANLSFEPELLRALGFTSSNLSEALLGALVVRHLCGGRPLRLAATKETLCFFVVAGLGAPLVGAFGGASTLSLTAAAAPPYWDTWFRWWLSDAMGILILCPLLLAWTPRCLAQLRSPTVASEVALLIVALSTIGIFVFSQDHIPVLYLITPLLFWPAIRLNAFWCALSGVLLTAIAVSLTIGQIGPLTAVSLDGAGDRVLYLQLFLGVAVFPPLVVAIALSERNRALEALGLGQLYLRELAELSADWLWATDKHFRLTSLSQAFFEITGRTAADTLGLNLRELTENAVEDTGKSAGQPLSAAAREPIRGLTFSLVGQDGREFRFALLGVPLFDSDGELCGYFGSATDVTASEAQRARLRALVTAIVDAIIVIDASGTIESLNTATEQLFGWKADELLGKNVNILMADPHQRADHNNYLQLHLETGRRRVIGTAREVTARRKDGREFPAELSVGKTRVAGKTKFVGILRDITEKKEAEALRERLEQQLYQSQKSDTLGNLARGIVHDVNNALVPIIGLTELTAEKLKEDSEEQRNLYRVLEAGDHAQTLIRQILAFSHTSPPERKPVEIQDAVREAIKLLRAGLPSTITLLDSIDSVSGFVLAGPAQIQQIVLNLGTNARDAVDASSGLITISLSELLVGPMFHPGLRLTHGRYFRLDVRDNGCGMDQDTRKRLFEPFFTTKSNSQAHGLGLWVVKGIVENLGGAISAQSTPSGGSAFSVFLPKARTRQDDLSDRAASSQC